MQRSSYSKPQLLHLFSLTSHLGTHRSCSYREKGAFTSSQPKMAEGRKGSFLRVLGDRSSGDGVGPVAQRIRARGYEPRCRGFESLLAHNPPFQEGPFPPGGRKIMIGIADAKLQSLGMVFCLNGVGMALFFLFFAKGFIITYSNQGRNQHICVLLPGTLPQPGLGGIAEQGKILVAQQNCVPRH